MFIKSRGTLNILMSYELMIYVFDYYIAPFNNSSLPAVGIGTRTAHKDRKAN